MKFLTRVALSLLFIASPFSAFAENANFTTSHFSGSDNCAACHDGLTDTSGENVSIVRDWGTSMMANASKDPFWQAKVATELERNPHLSTVINDTCTRCHAPMANYEITKVQGSDVTLFGPNGMLDTRHALYDAGMNGVSCTVCHQINDDAALGTLDGFSGKFTINDTKTIYGQFSDIFGQPMVNNTGYTPAYSAHVSDSALCASCHNLKTPYVDANGDVVSSAPETHFPEQMPYTEWQFSIFDDAGSNPQSCQDCHMPQTTSKVSNRPRWLGTKNGFAKHHLVGANTTMLTMLRDNATELGVTSTDMDLGIDRARAMLQSTATVEIVSASISNGVLDARVRVQNNSGHKAPTAYPSRRMWLNFKMTDSNNTVVFESGRINADGSIVGADNDTRPDAFEPHYEMITAADQVQIYEPVMGDSDGNITYTLLRAAQYLKDNRLTPRGFDKYSVPDDVAVRGQAFHDADFNQGSDEITYRVPVAAAGDIDVSVSLNYQTITHGFLQDLYSEGHLEQVQTFKRLYDAQSLKHEQVASAQTTVVNGGGTPPPGPLPVVSLWASSSSIDAGQSATLYWNASDASVCTASGAWSGTRNTTGSVSVSPTTTSTYTLTCEGDGGSTANSVTITVNTPPVVAAPTVNLSASPASVRRGSTITLSWSSTDANSCSASGSWSGKKSVSGSESIAISGPVTFNLSCSGEGGTASSSVSYTAHGRWWLNLQ